MAVGKVQKKGGKGGKGGKKKTVDPFLKKEWYDIKAPTLFKIRDQGKTPITKSSGTRKASEEIKGRVFDVNLCDLQEEMEKSRGLYSERRVRLIVDEVNGSDLLTNFHGIELTRDNIFDRLRKGISLVEAHCEGQTTDGYTLRVFVLANTCSKKDANDPKKKKDLKKVKAGYIQMAKIRAIRKKMVSYVTDFISKNSLKEVVANLIPDFIATQIQKQCRGITPLDKVAIKKVKVVKRPKDNLDKVREMHDESKVVDTGKPVHREKEIKVLGGGGKFN